MGTALVDNSLTKQRLAAAKRSRQSTIATASAVAKPAALSSQYVFSTDWGFMAIVGRDHKLTHLYFNYAERSELVAKLRQLPLGDADMQNWHPELVERLIAYAAGQMVDFSDICIETAGMSPFCRAIVEQTRLVTYGQTVTYGQLALRAGFPGAARAVGNVMRTNRLPLVVPCHRITRCGGQIGDFSAPGGEDTKRRLLAMEQVGQVGRRC